MDSLRLAIAAAEKERDDARKELAEERINTDIILRAAVQTLIQHGRYADAFALFARFTRTLTRVRCRSQVDDRRAGRHVHARGTRGCHHHKRAPRRRIH